MRKLKIETYQGKEPTETIHIPLALVNVLAKMFAGKSHESVVSAINEAAKIKEFNGVVLEIEEHQNGGEKTIFSIV
ncbi:hypothetical protein [Motiliproteus sp. SC1-56]|uniref:hypothetical protein n=1 Tax=Motiliproteus sp. SC1-56 TaxID=2799565 RepID=UPI001A8DCDAD|nr:hypothetical protein [Motiliproteus sp. SC1-56]